MMISSKSAEIIVIIVAILAGIAIFILLLFFCTRHQKRLPPPSFRPSREGRGVQSPGGDDGFYFGALGWFCRYDRQRQIMSKDSPMNRI